MSHQRSVSTSIDLFFSADLCCCDYSTRNHPARFLANFVKTHIIFTALMSAGSQREDGQVSAEIAKGIPAFPRDVFLMIIDYLDYMDVIYCRRVSRAWHDAFTNSDNLYPLLRLFFPLAREVRELASQSHHESSSTTLVQDNDWCRLFDQIAMRYFGLSKGKAHSTEKYQLWPDYYWRDESQSLIYPVQPWDAHRSHPSEKLDYNFLPPSWTYEDGLIVFPSLEKISIILLDLETNKSLSVPFSLDRKAVRRLRLQDKLLVIEWAESESFHRLNDLDTVHRHFASSFDIRRSSDGWDIQFRNEWKIMFLGHPLSDRDRFYSTHTRTHYAIYAWQPNRSLYTAEEDAPIESLFVWDISEPSNYKPSNDPAGWYGSTEGPFIITRLSFRELEFHRVRQRGVPGILRLDIHSDVGVLDITENIYGIDLLTPFPFTKVTSIPVIGYGPSWPRNVNTKIPPYRGCSNVQARPMSSSCNRFNCISEVSDTHSQLCFTHQFEPHIDPQDRRSSIIIQSTKWISTLDSTLTSEISRKGIVCGDERFIIGENGESELVILRFDR